MTRFTPDQQRCIATVDRDLIVSAGAGAGKTATLVERIHTILANQEDPCTLDEILVVTFSRLAASEMKERLAARLRRSVEDPATTGPLRDHLERQLYLLPRAPISTIHSYCLSVISDHPDRAGLAPGFELMGEEEARLFRLDFFRGKIRESLDGDTEIAWALKRILAELDVISGVEGLERMIVDLHGFLESIPFPARFVEGAIALYRHGGDAPPPEARQLLERHLRIEVDTLLGRIRRFLHRWGVLIQGRLRPQVDHFAALAGLLGEIEASDAPLDLLAPLLGAPPPPRWSADKKNPGPHDDAFRADRDALVEDCRDGLKRLAPFQPPGVYTETRASARLVEAFLRTCGLEWGDKLFQLHLENRRLTFSHLERLALRVLTDGEGNPTATARIQRDRFRHILVDEFQDVNEVQELLLRSIARPTTDESGGNLFVVGDVKQSIYEFRQADPTIFLRRFDASVDLDPVAAAKSPARLGLKENFRSHAALLDEFNRLFSLLLLRDTIGLDYTNGHAFVAGREEKPRPRAPEFSITLLPRAAMPGAEEEEAEEDFSLEAEHVAHLVERIGPPWKDICILLRSTVGTAAELTTTLERRGIPTFCDSRLGFLTAVEVLEFQAILKCVDNPCNDPALLATLRGPAARWSEDDLLALRAINHDAFLIDNLQAAAAGEAHPLAARAAPILERINRWQALSTRQSMSDFFGLLFDELHLVESASVRPAGDQRKLNLLYLLERARQFDGFLAKGLAAFLRFLDDLIANEEDFAPPSPLPEDADVVRIMSVHKSKGAQFPVVICPFLGRQFNDLSLRAPFLHDRAVGTTTRFRDEPRPDAGNPPLHEVMARMKRDRARGEELRLFYVALTRAMEAVHLTGSLRNLAEAWGESQYRASAGVPSARDILAARSPLDWLLPCLHRRFTAPPDISTPIHVADGIASLHVYPDAASAVEAMRGELPSVAPSTVAPAPDPAVIASLEDAARRLAAAGRAAPPPLVRAKVSVTELKRLYEAVRDRETPSFRPPARPDAGRGSWIPARLRPDAAPSTGGTERGSATHRFLALCDLERLSRGEASLSGERDRLVAARLLTPEQAGVIDLPAIQWFLNGPLGKRVRRAAGRLHREQPFTAGIQVAEVDPAAGLPDLVVLQSVVDLLFQDDTGWILVDYKTDFCGTDGARIPALLRSYTPQLQLYRMAVERTIGAAVAESWLVFLQGRRIEPVPAGDSAADAWKNVVAAGAVIYTDPERTTFRLRSV